MATAMKGVTRAMVRMNRQINLPALQQIMMEFEKQSQIMDMKEEVISDTMEEMWESDGEEEETDEIVNQILDEIGINLKSELVNAPSKQMKAAVTTPSQMAAAAAADVDEDRILQDRLNNLRQDLN
eukprot:TRINITY_DN2046_c0_g2_i6.p2 TRINITY_DN2046_c0_g2~~TRINITY_DN2046_c0_g2_i6.p2  ORF type:complete len:126 (+),score=42.27 TRINITY_DN2046_c0_g2_i6:462-839(+)